MGFNGSSSSAATCPPEIADGKPAVLILDSDDFKVNTVSCKALAAHWTNIMFPQPGGYKKVCRGASDKIAKEDVSAQLKNVCLELKQIRQYRCPLGSKSDLMARSSVEMPLNGMYLHRTHTVRHVLSRTDNFQTRPLPDEPVPAYSSAQSCGYPPSCKSKPYYHTI